MAGDIYSEPYFIPVTITDPATGAIVEHRELRVLDTPDGAVFGEEGGPQKFATHQTDEAGNVTYSALDRLMSFHVVALSKVVEVAP
jgi:hypothetical protein